MIMRLRTLTIASLIICFVLILTGCGVQLALLPVGLPASQTETRALMPLVLKDAHRLTTKITRNYTWKFSGIEWTWELRIPESLYNYYRELPRPSTRDYSVYITHPIDDACIDKMVTEIGRIAQRQHFNERETIEFTAAFVQSLPYAEDSVATPYEEYPRYPLETLFDMAGDCEDTSILLASLLDRMGLGVVLVYFPSVAGRQGHYGIGVLSVEGIYGTNWEYDGKRYFYIETTRKGMRMGAISGVWAGASPEIIALTPSPFLIYDWKATTDGGIVELEVTIENIGLAKADNVYIFAGFEVYDEEEYYGGNILYNTEKSRRFDILAGQSKVVRLTLEVPVSGYGVLLINVIYNGSVVDKGYFE